MKTKLNGFLTLFIALLVQISFAQERIVTGVVSDNSGLPIPGVNVLVKGTKLGTQTDFDGKFSIKASPSQTLIFNFIGMKTQEIVASSSTINVKMKDNAVELEGVVVTALGVKRQKKAIGSATASVSGKDLTEVNNTNIFESLSGKVAGVDITAPAQVGASSKVVIRGYNTFGNASPLYIIDGTPITNGSSSGTGNTRSFDAGNGIGDVDPNNIENMTILKGAAASALYGSRASNGVIVITTKTGKNKSKLTVETSHSAEFSQVMRVPHFQNSFGQGWNAKSWSNYGATALSDNFGNTASNENGSWGPAFNGQVRPMGINYQ
jgi:TonB-dependent SusC/RagA subfamily outer membrane receptor